MRAMVLSAHGGVENLNMQDIPDPRYGSNQVRVAVRAVAMNHLDIWVRKGWKGLDLEMPHILGSDMSGVVEAVGDEVTGIAVGDEVVIGPGVACGRCRMCLAGADNRCRQYKILGEHTRGGYAELVTVPARNVFRKPKHLSFEEAACLPLVFTTAWGMLVETGRLQAGETVLIQAGGSGVGSAAIQIAKFFGATVITTASTDAKLEKARELGADHTVNYTTEDFVKRVKTITDRRGVDLVFEHVGGKTFAGSLRSLTVGGRLVTCGATSAPTAEVDIRVLFAKHLSIIGNTMGSLSAMLPIIQHAERGVFQPVLDTVMPLEDAVRGHEHLANRAQFGKVVLKVTA